jgi:predicted Zn-ribbon and HTH transcriptional regulator
MTKHKLTIERIEALLSGMDPQEDCDDPECNECDTIAALQELLDRRRADEPSAPPHVCILVSKRALAQAQIDLLSTRGISVVEQETTEPWKYEVFQPPGEFVYRDGRQAELQQVLKHEVAQALERIDKAKEENLPPGFIWVAQCAGCGVTDNPQARHFSECPAFPSEPVRPAVNRQAEAAVKCIGCGAQWGGSMISNVPDLAVCAMCGTTWRALNRHG